MPGRLPGRHRLRHRVQRWVHDPALGWLLIEEEVRVDPQQEDLTADDHLVETTAKDDPDGLDEGLPAPSQDPAVVYAPDGGQQQ